MDYWQKEGISIVDGLNELIRKKKNEKHKDTLLEILRQIKNNFTHKKSHKKVNKFMKLVSTHKDISLKRSIYFVYWFHRIFNNVQDRSKEINVRNFVSREESTICMDKDHKSG